MAKLCEMIEALTDGENIESVIVGKHDRDFFNDGEPFNDVKINTPILWEEAAPFLSYEYDNGYGGADCHPVFAYTQSRIIVITEYDGATGATWFPRNPVEVKVGFDGVDDFE